MEDRAIGAVLVARNASSLPSLCIPTLNLASLNQDEQRQQFPRNELPQVSQCGIRNHLTEYYSPSRIPLNNPFLGSKIVVREEGILMASGLREVVFESYRSPAQTARRSVVVGT
jgi:hypothetical protein